MAEIFNERQNLNDKEVDLTLSLTFVYQMIILLHEVKKIYPLLVSSKSMFYPYLLTFKEDLRKIFKDVFEEGKNPEMEHQNFANHKISQFLNKKFNVSSSKVSKQIKPNLLGSCGCRWEQCRPVFQANVLHFPVFNRPKIEVALFQESHFRRFKVFVLHLSSKIKNLISKQE